MLFWGEEASPRLFPCTAVESHHFVPSEEAIVGIYCKRCLLKQVRHKGVDFRPGMIQTPYMESKEKRYGGVRPSYQMGSNPRLVEDDFQGSVDP